MIEKLTPDADPVALIRAMADKLNEVIDAVNAINLRNEVTRYGENRHHWEIWEAYTKSFPEDGVGEFHEWVRNYELQHMSAFPGPFWGQILEPEKYIPYQRNG